MLAATLLPEIPPRAAAPIWAPLGSYPIDRRSGEGPEVLLAWTDEHGRAQTGIGTGFFYWDDEANRGSVLFQSGGRIRRATRFAYLGSSQMGAR